MGVEYKIQFQVNDERTIESFLRELSSTFENEISVSLEKDGIYFCDNLTDKIIASKVFYSLVEKVLTQNTEIKILGL